MVLISNVLKLESLMLYAKINRQYCLAIKVLQATKSKYLFICLVIKNFDSI